MANICQYLSAAAAKSPHKVLTAYRRHSKTAHHINTRVAALAAALIDKLAVQPGDVVVLALDSTDYFLECLLAVAAAGAISAPLNLRWSTTEAAAAINLCQPRLILLDSSSLHLQDLVNSQSCSCLHHAIIIGSPTADPMPNVAWNGEQLIKNYVGSELLVRTPPDGAAIICFTSGTTGQPKGALISHTALHCQAMAKVLTVGYNASDIYLHAAPLFHIGGLSSAIAVLMVGGMHVFMGRFNATDALDIIASKQITSFIAVPAMIADLTAAAAAKSNFSATAGGAASATYHCVQRVLVGAGGMSSEQVTRMQAVFPEATVHSAYGMTEACSSMTFKLLVQPISDGRPSCRSAPRSSDSADLNLGAGVNVGNPPPGIQMGVLNPPANKQVNGAVPNSTAFSPGLRNDLHTELVGVGKGELVTRGPHVLMCYWGQPTETSQVMLPGAWLRTGDIGSIDAEGNVWIKGRVRDVIRSGGESVHAVEVEQVLTQHPAILAAAVFGIPHPRFGEQVAAVLSLSKAFAWTGPMCGVQGTPPNAVQTLTPASLQAFCRQATLSAYKLPRFVAAQYEPLPLNASGKTMKMQLKHVLLEALHVLQDQAPGSEGVVAMHLPHRYVSSKL